MASVFAKIIAGELPGHFVWRDARAVAFLSIAPLRPGHTLVVPVQEVDHWLDCEAPLLSHLTAVAKTVGEAVQRAFGSARVGLIIAGLEVPHTHLHVVPLDEMPDLDFANANTNAKPEELAAAAQKIRAVLQAAGHKEAGA